MKNNIRKSVKRWLALVMTAIMVFAMATTVMAVDYSDNNTSGSTTTAAVTSSATTGYIKINSNNSDATYTYYKIASAEVETGSGTYTWTINSDYLSTIATALGLTGSYTNDDVVAALAKANASTMQSVASALESLTLSGGTTLTANTDEQVALGYYLIVESGTTGLEKSQPILIAVPQVQNGEWVYNIQATPKSSSTDFTKKIADSGSLVDTSTADIGDYVDYRLYADIPTYDDDAYSGTLTFTITDNMSEGLTWGSKSAVTVYVVDSEADADIAALTATNGGAALTAIDNTSEQYYSLTIPSTGEAGGTFTVTFTNKFLKDYAGKVVIVAFSAQLNSSAKIADETGYKISGYDTVKDENYNGEGNPNGATLEYTNSYYGGTGTEKIKETVTTFTFELNVEKVDADDNTEFLAGAEFKIYTDSTCEAEYSNTKYSNPLTSVATGVVTAYGLDEGTYYLKETKAPSGYSLYDGTIKVVIVADKDQSGEYTGTYTYTVTIDGNETASLTKVTVKDEEGVTMPGTGGIGTTLFTFGGLALVILAAILFIVYTKKQKKQA